MKKAVCALIVLAVAVFFCSPGSAEDSQSSSILESGPRLPGGDTTQTISSPTATPTQPTMHNAVAKASIAVFPFQAVTTVIQTGPDSTQIMWTEESTTALVDDIINRLVNSRKFNVLERRHLEAIFAENDLTTQAGYYDSSDALNRAMQLSKATYVVVGSIQHVSLIPSKKKIPYTERTRYTLSGKMIVHLRVVDSTTGSAKSAQKVTTTLVYTTEGLKDGRPAAEPLQATVFLEKLKEKAANELVQRVISAIYPLKVASVNRIPSGEIQAIVNQGKDFGTFSIGDRFTIYQTGGVIEDPDTHEILGNNEIPIASGIVSAMSAKVSTITIDRFEQDGNGGMIMPKVGDVCRQPDDYMSDQKINGTTEPTSGTNVPW